jgi:hypothetical protein
VEQYCSIWRMAGLQSSYWRGCEERRAEMCDVHGWAAPTHPRFVGDLVRRDSMRWRDLTGQESYGALAALASRRSNSSLSFLFPTSCPYLLPSVSPRAAGRRHKVPHRSDFHPIFSRAPCFFIRKASARATLATLGRQIKQGRHLTHAELGDLYAQKFLAPGHQGDD